MPPDTKYKQPTDQPSNSDVSQVAVYAMVKDCGDAFLIYPAELGKPFDTVFESSGIHVRTLGFPLDGDLESAGELFLRRLLGGLAPSGAPQP